MWIKATKAAAGSASSRGMKGARWSLLMVAVLTSATCGTNTTVLRLGTGSNPSPANGSRSCCFLSQALEQSEPLHLKFQPNRKNKVRNTSRYCSSPADDRAHSPLVERAHHYRWSRAVLPVPEVSSAHRPGRHHYQNQPRVVPRGARPKGSPSTVGPASTRSSSTAVQHGERSPGPKR